MWLNFGCGVELRSHEKEREVLGNEASIKAHKRVFLKRNLKNAKMNTKHPIYFLILFGSGEVNNRMML